MNPAELDTQIRRIALETAWNLGNRATMLTAMKQGPFAQEVVPGAVTPVAVFDIDPADLVGRFAEWAVERRLPFDSWSRDKPDAWQLAAGQPKALIVREGGQPRERTHIVKSPDLIKRPTAKLRTKRADLSKWPAEDIVRGVARHSAANSTIWG